MSEDDLRLHFQLVRESISTWSADTARFVAAAAKARESGRSDPEISEAAARTLAAVRREQDGLSDAAQATEMTDNDLIRGIETALAELGSLDKNIAEALDQLR